MDQYEVFPKGDGWNWRLRKNGKSAGSGDGYDTRGEAIAAAREENDGEHQLVLCRKNGSEVGELPAQSAAARTINENGGQ